MREEYNLTSTPTRFQLCGHPPWFRCGTARVYLLIFKNTVQ